MYISADPPLLSHGSRGQHFVHQNIPRIKHETIAPSCDIMFLQLYPDDTVLCFSLSDGKMNSETALILLLCYSLGTVADVICVSPCELTRPPVAPLPPVDRCASCQVTLQISSSLSPYRH